MTAPNERQQPIELSPDQLERKTRIQRIVSFLNTELRITEGSYYDRPRGRSEYEASGEYKKILEEYIASYSQITGLSYDEKREAHWLDVKAGRISKTLTSTNQYPSRWADSPPPHVVVEHYRLVGEMNRNRDIAFLFERKENEAIEQYVRTGQIPTQSTSE